MRADIEEGAGIKNKPIPGPGSRRQECHAVSVRQVIRQFPNVGLPQSDDVMMPLWQLAIASVGTGIGGAREGELVTV